MGPRVRGDAGVVCGYGCFGDRRLFDNLPATAASYIEEVIGLDIIRISDTLPTI
jgi:hypothetical protein